MKSLGFLVLSCLALEASPRDWTAELRAGAYIPLSSRIQKAYGHGWIEGEAEFTYQFIPHWRVFGNVNYSRKVNHLYGRHIHIQILPFSAGIKYVFSSGKIRPYAGLGPSYTFLHLTHFSPTIRKKAYKNRFGFVAKSGVYFDLPRHFLLDVFFDYYYQKTHFQSGVIADVGGFRTGLGFGYSF